MFGRRPSAGRVVRISQPSPASFAAAVALALVLASCGGAAPSPTPAPTAVPTPTPTPNPHLAEPASVDTVFTWLNGHGLTVIGNNADRGPSGEPLKRINATYAGWPLILSEYSTGALARKSSGVGPKAAKPVADEAPFTFLGLNIVVDFGPQLRRDDDPAPDPRFVDAATKLATALDALLGPLGIRSVVRVALPMPLATPAPSSSAAPSGVTGSPRATPRPSQKTTAKPSLKPTPEATPKPSG